MTGASGIDYRNVSGEPEKRFIVSSLGAGAGLLDYDQDGDLDLYLVNGAPLDDRTPGPGLPNRLFRNEGGFRFTDRTEAAGVGDTGWGYGVAAADVDNDGFPDLYVTNLGENVLYRNRGDGTFDRMPDAGGARHPGFSASAALSRRGERRRTSTWWCWATPPTPSSPSRSRAPGRVASGSGCRSSAVPRD